MQFRTFYRAADLDLMALSITIVVTDLLLPTFTSSCLAEASFGPTNLKITFVCFSFVFIIYYTHPGEHPSYHT